MGYENFYKDVLEAYKLIIRDYYFTYEVNNPNYSIELKNNSILLSFSLDYLDLKTVFINPKDDKGKEYWIGIFINIYAFSNNKNIENYVYNSANPIENIKETLNFQADLLHKMAPSLFTGNFTWVEKYNQFEDNEKYIYKTLGREFSPSHPVYKKFIANDESWKEDILKFKNDIS
ncbi:MAG: hypothetical protein M0D57_00140 [Sphingobacteriales bacterium JAD_PAG50586_3]|nr:MAG: hypothetical protein M0D57_00140 [Sphingobacteriales bacterium JAD_PAG50586_3]